MVPRESAGLWPHNRRHEPNLTLRYHAWFPRVSSDPRVGSWPSVGTSYLVRAHPGSQLPSAGSKNTGSP